VFLGSIVLAGGALALGLASGGIGGGGPVALSAIPAAVAAAGIAAALGFARARRRPGDRADLATPTPPTPTETLTSRVRHGGLLVGGAVHDAIALVRTADRRLAGAVGYWIFDAAVLWAMLNAFGSPPSLAVVALAYFVGQAANTLPIPGSVSGGIAGVLIAFGAPVGLALPAVLAYRAIAVWLPAPIAAAAIPRLRATIGRWSAEDASAAAS
jgi:uncharacterized membrane protein YbhN (UPF0104 family)